MKDLPSSQDEMWSGEKIVADMKPIELCATHTKENWFKHQGYTLNADGSITCKECAWGTRMPGYYRLVDGKVVDLRNL